MVTIALEKTLEKLSRSYISGLTSYKRRKTREVNIGGVPLGGNNPIRVQSMTTADTMNTRESVEQSIRMINAGAEYVRLTAPSIKEAENLRVIKEELHKRGYNTPLIADIHFTPNAAELAARIVEKVRINPGNYADKKKFQTLEYTDETYRNEIDRIRNRFLPLIKICKENGTAMRIGTNHGSLSDRIMSRYGDTPLGMVESALEFLRICEDEKYYDIILSMKASNPQIMVQAYRLLVKKLEEEKLQPYPLHLGVTEAGEAEDGRIKSAMGIGTLLEDGLGDTIRVSLTEEPEYEIPVAIKLVERYIKPHVVELKPIDKTSYNPFEYQKRLSTEVGNIGGIQVPRVIANLENIREWSNKALEAVGHYYLPEPDKWGMKDNGCDYIYTGNNPVNFMLPNGLREIVNYNNWLALKDSTRKYPLIDLNEFNGNENLHSELNFIRVTSGDVLSDRVDKIKELRNAVLILTTDALLPMKALRRSFVELDNKDIKAPVVIALNYENSKEEFLLNSAIDLGGQFIDGFGDGVMIGYEDDPKFANETAFGILQASRQRMSKTEYISCPSCGRTLFDLQDTTAMIRKKTDHLKGLKIGIMGCIVNGPGEMADADYGYVGSGKDKITLYRGKEVVKKGVPSQTAVDELIELIRADGKWLETNEDN